MRTVHVLASSHERANSLAEQLHRQLASIGYALRRTEYQRTLFGDVQIGESIRQMRRADIVLAIIAEFSANVLFELGYAAALGKPLLIVTSREIEFPAELAKLHSLRLDLASPEAVYEIARALERVSVDRPLPRRNYDSLDSKLRSYWSDPDYFDAIEPQEFEALVWELCQADGFQPTHLEGDRDIGFDFALQNYAGHRLALVEVKKPERSTRLSIGVVQRLMGNVFALEADCGVIVSPSEFTRSALDFAEKCHPRIELWGMARLVRSPREDGPRMIVPG